MRVRETKHGRADSRIYRVYQAMKQRCYNPKTTGYKHYGGRGITVCDRWLGEDGFENFLTDMGERPEGLTLDRIDVNGNYEPANCRWATPAEQTENRREYWYVTHIAGLEARIAELEAQLTTYQKRP